MNIPEQETRPLFLISLEQALIGLGLATAVSLRFLNLGVPPLSDAEATWALQALEIARAAGLRSQVEVGAQPAYLFLTGLSFYLFGATNFLARFWPALSGVFLVILPLLFRPQLGRAATLIALWGLALDPGLVTVSRQAGGPMMAYAFLLLSLGLWRNKKIALAGVTAGVGLLSGQAVFQGLLGIGLAWLTFKVLSRRRQTGSNQRDPQADSTFQVEGLLDKQRLPFSPVLRTALIAFTLTFFLIGSGFLLYPQGLAAWFQSLALFLDGWVTPSGVPPLMLVSALTVFQPLALVFAILGLVRLQISSTAKATRRIAAANLLALWLAFGLLIGLVYPARQVSDLIWVLLPLWGLAAGELEKYMPDGQPNLISLLQAGLIIILVALFWNTLISTRMLTPGEGISPGGIRLMLLGGILALGTLTTILIALGWSWEISRNGLVWGIVSASLIYLVSALWGASQLRANDPVELWGRTPGTGQEDLLLSSLRDLSNWQTGMAHEIQILSTVDNPSLRWALRSFQNARFLSALPPGELPVLLITSPDQETPALESTYRGQDFLWRTWRGWKGALPEDWLSWLTFRQAPITAEQIILWGRSDIFPGAASNPQSQPGGEP